MVCTSLIRTLAHPLKSVNKKLPKKEIPDLPRGCLPVTRKVGRKQRNTGGCLYLALPKLMPRELLR